MPDTVGPIKVAVNLNGFNSEFKLLDMKRTPRLDDNIDTQLAGAIARSSSTVRFDCEAHHRFGAGRTAHGDVVNKIRRPV